MTISRLFPITPFIAAIVLTIGVLTFFGLAPAEAAPKKNNAKAEPAPPAISDELVPRYLSPQELREWRDGLQELEYIQANIESGNWLANKQYSQFVQKSRIDSDRKKGEEMVKAAKKKLPAVKEKLDGLRLAAAERYAANQEKFSAQSRSVKIPAATTEGILKKPLETVLFSIWNRGYNRIYFAGAFAFSGDQYRKSDAYSEKMSEAIAKYDGNRYTFESSIDPAFTLASGSNQPVIEFADRLAVTSQFKPAMVIADIIYDPEAPQNVITLSAIDLKSGSVIDQSTLVFGASEQDMDYFGAVEKAGEALPVSDQNAEADDLSAPASGEAAEANMPDAEPTASPKDEAMAKNKPGMKKESQAPQPLDISLVDENNFLGRLAPAASNYLFTVDYVGQVGGFDEYSSLALNRTFLISQGFQVDIFSALEKMLPVKGDAGLSIPSNAVWRVTPLSPIEFGAGTFSATAESRQSGNSASIEIGELLIGSPSVIPPQAANESR